MKYILFLLLFSQLFFSCTVSKPQPTMQDVVNSWMGSKKSEIIMEWGPPSGGVTSDGKGGEILIYNNMRTIYMKNPYAPSGFSPTIGKTINNYRQVYCDPNGTIYYIRWGRE
jgi:hypothetical protein